MVSYSRRPQSGQITCYLNRTYHVLATPLVERMCHRPRPLRVGNPRLFLRLPLLRSSSHRHARSLRTSALDYARNFTSESRLSPRTASPPRTASSASGRFTVPCIVAPQIAPDTTRDASGAAFNRLGVKGSLSAISSLIASLAILFEALAEIILANGESRGRIHLRFSAQAITADAVIGRKPATAPMPIANAEAYWCFIFVSGSQSHSQHTHRRGLNDFKSSHLTALLANTFCGIYRLRQSLHSHLESRWLTNPY